ncbi:MAG TPA: ATP-binding protein [Tepidisphaeraceae bacterium]
MPEEVIPQIIKKPRLIQRGESLVASIGISLAAIVMLAMGAATWWTVAADKQSVEQLRAAQIQRSAELLAQSASTMLASNELSGLRSLLIDAAREDQLEDCRISLPDGQIIADSNPGKITVHKMPDHWPAGKVQEGGKFQGDNYSFGLSVPGKGLALLQIDPGIEALAAHWETQAGLGAIGVAALVALLIVYRRLRRRMRAVGAIGEALLAMTAGEKNSDALKIALHLGPEAIAWNALLDEKDEFRKQQAAQTVSQSLGNRREGKGQLEAACDALSQGLLLLDDGMHIKFANGAAGSFLGAAKEKLLGQSVGELVKEEKVVSVVKNIAQGTSRQRATVEWERRGPTGQSVLRLAIRPVRKEDGAAAMVIIEDITQQRVAEESRNTFVAQATHELRAPLTNMRMYIETAIEDGENDPVTRAKCLNVINIETRRLERIVGEMLSISEIEAGAFTVNRTDIYAEQIFKELQEDYAEAASEKQISLVFNLPPKLPAIKGDRDKIMSALHNLVQNAIKYTLRGGKVTVTVEEKNGMLVVEVADNGIGIPEEDQERVFEKFMRGQDPRVEKITGTGLGLTLAREVIKLHGGTISLQSELNKGSTFTVNLPSAQAA